MAKKAKKEIKDLGAKKRVKGGANRGGTHFPGEDWMPARNKRGLKTSKGWTPEPEG